MTATAGCSLLDDDGRLVPEAIEVPEDVIAKIRHGHKRTHIVRNFKRN